LQDTLRRLNDPHFVRRHQLQEQIAEWDRRAFLKDARNQGLAEGHKQGLEQGRKETVLALLREKMPLDLIVRVTTLSAEKIRDIGKLNGIL